MTGRRRKRSTGARGSVGTTRGWRVALVGALAATSLVTLSLPAFSVEVSGNVGTQVIEIESNANLYPGGPAEDCTPLQTGTDWVKDCTANTDTPAGVVDSIATGIVPNVSGATGGTGHWNGARIVDGIAQGDQNIFLTGGKENKPNEWNIGPGSVGSSKYDITQAYLANNATDVFFGMERRGTNGTTAFDFEFNQLAPTTNPLGAEVPTRSTGDILLTFEMQGSGGSGSATPHYYTYSAAQTKYVESTTLPAGILSYINTSAVPAAPWGYVNSQGNWALGSLDKFSFAEAKVDLDLLDPSGTFDACAGASRFVQVRTRSSSVDTSDLKDTTDVFSYSFFEPQEPSTTLQSACTQSFTYSTSATTAGWTFTVPNGSGVTLSGTGVTQSSGNANVYTTSAKSGTVAVSLPAGMASVDIDVAQSASDANGCSASGSGTVTVYRTLTATATISPLCDNQLSYSSVVTGGKAPYSYAWSFKHNTGTVASPVWTEVGTSTSASGTFDADDVANGGVGAYRADLTVRDTADTSSGGKPQCSATDSKSTTVYDAVGGTLTVTPDCDNTFGFSSSASGGNGSYTYAWTLQKKSGDTYTDAASGTTSSGTLDINSGVSPGGEGTYRMLMTITDTQTGLTCKVDLTSADFTVRNALTSTASKAPDAGRTSVTLTATPSSTSGVSYQWAKRSDANAFVAIPGATSATYAGYSAFETDDTTPTDLDHTIGTDAYQSKIYVVDFQVTVTRTLNGTLCSTTATVTVKKIVGVDP